MEEDMSLLDDAMETCVIMDKTTQPDGYGGYISTYREGAQFNAAIVFDTSIEARVADKQGVTSLYTITTPKALTLEYHDVFKRLRDGKVFRVTSDGDDKFTPASATLNMRQVTAEELVL
jgi:hypothetical protein